MQPTNRSSRILLPVKLWFVYLTLFAALGLEYIPSGRTPGLPDWVALVLAFWCVREPLAIGMGVGFVFGLLMDVGLGLGKMDGWEATRTIKAQPATAGIPIIALTAHAMATDRQKSVEVGCADFDTKPVDFNRLLAKIMAQLQDVEHANH